MQSQDGHLNLSLSQKRTQTVSALLWDLGLQTVSPRNLTIPCLCWSKNCTVTEKQRILSVLSGTEVKTFQGLYLRMVCTHRYVYSMVRLVLYRN